MLSQVERQSNDDKVLYSQNSSDDAGVYQISDDLAMVQTVDYFTPVVDDAYTFGQIAAANALSDVYAMGADVKTALNIVGFSVKKYGSDVLARILQGAEDQVHQAGGSIVGGHSIDDDEPKFGLSVTGFVHPDNLWTNIGAQLGDALVLTKPIGIGIATTAIKKDLASPKIVEEAIKWMTQLNKETAEQLRNYKPNAVTDVTGFGLLGHAYELAKGSQQSLTIYNEQVPVMDGISPLVEQGAVPGGTKANLNWLKDVVSFEENVNEESQLILADAITSGGLLISMNTDEAVHYVNRVNQLNGYKAHIIGEVVEVEGQESHINVK
ncbi:selenide, water dikinase SelD [Alkalibacillus silvisoli]|uniref:Selenide, water dikinase SelD n=1 Tax=Alkalibacillus silvisoli TaxID=392823 RepID=A0ABN0ZX80_9BACI